MIINLYFPAHHCVTEDLSPPRSNHHLMSVASPGSHLTQLIVFKNWTQDTVWHTEGGEGNIFFLLQPTAHKRATNWKAVESYWSESYSTFYSWHKALRHWLPGLQSSCSSVSCILWQSCSVLWRGSWQLWHVTQSLVTQAAVSPRIAPSSLISPSEARRLRVINSPPDTNLFQLLRGRGKTNTHITCLGVASQTSRISQSCSPSPGTGQPTERIIIYDLCHFYFPRSFKWRKECLVCDVLAASRLRPRRF